jgi:hypothetical protein
LASWWRALQEAPTEAMVRASMLLEASDEALTACAYCAIITFDVNQADFSMFL